MNTCRIDLSTIGIGLALLLLVVIIRRRYFSPVSDIPGPFVASFSLLWQFYHVIDGHTEKATIELHRKYGPFVRISHKEVSIGHPDGIREVLVAPLPKSGWYQAFSLPDRRYINQMSELDPKRHIHKAKNVASGYAFSNVIKSEPYIDNALKLLETQFDFLAKKHQPVHFDHWFNYFAFDVVGEVTFSRRFGFLDSGSDVRNAIANTRVLGIYISFIGHVYWLHDFLLANPLIGWLNLKPSMHIFDTCLAALDARSKNNDTRKDMLAQWIETRSKYPDRMEEKEILAAAVVNLGAGADTISAVLQAFFYYLLHNRAALEKVQAEVDAASNRNELSKIVSHAEAQNLPYLQACIKEALRFHTPVAFGLPRVAPKNGVTILGRFFPEGTVLSINPWVIHRDPSLFGADADEFNPDRWMDVERAKEMNKYMVPFGAGYNQCPGRFLAQLELSKVAATLLRDFDIVQVDPEQNWRYESHFTAIPYDWPCWVTRRKSKAN